MLFSGCTTIKRVDANWLGNNCPGFSTFIADYCESYTNCSTTNGTMCLCVYDNGDWYDGELRNGKPHGFGTYDYGNTNSYRGYYLDGQQSCGIQSNSNSDYWVFKNGKVIDSGNNISEGVEVGLAVILVAGVAYAIANSSGTNGGSGSSSDSDWDWDWQPANLTWVCRGISTGQYASLDKCQYDTKNDTRWPN